MTDTTARLDALEVRLGIRDSRPPEDEWDQQHASYLLGCEAELTEARSRKDRPQIDAITVEMKALLDGFTPERRKAVRKLMEHDRPLRGQPMPKMCDVLYVDDRYQKSGSTETRHFRNGSTETVDSATGESTWSIRPTGGSSNNLVTGRPAS